MIRVVNCDSFKRVMPESEGENEKIYMHGLRLCL